MSQLKTELTPIEMAYALPGGLARLATDGAWDYAPHLEYIEDKLMSVVGGKCRRMCISVPPQHGKSMLASQHFTAWYLGRYPARNVVLASYESTFAASWGRKARNVLEEFGEQVFGIKVSSRTAAAAEWEIEGHGGGMITAGAGGPITGRRGDLIIIDDPIKNQQEAMSAGRHKELFDWYISVIRTRMSPTCAIIIIMTRWAYDDLIGRVTRHGKNIGYEWEYVRLPALAEEDDPLGRKPGEVMWPGHYPLEFYKEQKESQESAYWFNTQYQQRPAPRSGFLVDIGWFRRYHQRPPRDQVSQVVLSLDTASKENELADYTVVTVWYMYENMYYLVDLVRERWSMPTLLAQTIELDKLWKPNAVLIEDKGSGIGLIQHLEKETTVPVLGQTPTADKVIRMQVETPAIQAGRVYIPAPGLQDWVHTFEEEVRGFPYTTFKDQVDSLSQFLKYIREGANSLEMWS